MSDAFSAVEQPAGSGILAVSFSAGDPEQAAIILNAIMDDFQRQNVEKKGAEAEQTIQFLEKQLPLLKERVDAAEGAYNAYLQEHGSVDISREGETVLAGVVETEGELFRLQQEREGLRERFKPTHPKIQSLDGLISKLQEKLDNLEKQTQTLPAVQQTALRLRRDVEVNTTLYSSLIKSLQELRMAKAGTVGNARIVDYAWPPIYRDCAESAKDSGSLSRRGLRRRLWYRFPDNQDARGRGRPHGDRAAAWSLSRWHRAVQRGAGKDLEAP